MTDDLDPRDELASAHLDGASSPDEAAQVASDPDLAARVAAMAAVRQAIATDTGPIDGARRDRAIATALAAADGGDVVALDAARRRARRRTRLLGVAAALVLAGAVTVGLLTRDDHPTHTTAASVPKAADRATSGSTELGLGRADEDAATTTVAQPLFSGTTGGSTGQASASVGIVELGAYPDLRALGAAVRAQLSGQAAPLPDAPPEAAAAAQVCVAHLQARGTRGSPVFTGVGTLAGRAVVAIVVDDAGVERLTTVSPAPACATVAATRL